MRARGALLLAWLAAACSEPVPSKYLSLADRAPADPGQPGVRVSALWLHHGCTAALLRAGLAQALKKRSNVAVVSLGHGKGKVAAKLAPAGAATSEGRYVIGDHTGPAELAATFSRPALLAALRRHGAPADKPHRLVLFNSCPGMTRLPDAAAVARQRAAYQRLLPHLRRRQDVLFVLLTTPPLTVALADSAERARARALARWLARSLSNAPNVRVFDLFDALAVRKGHPAANALATQFARSARDPRPTRPAAALAVARLFVPWLNLAMRSRGFR